MSSERSARWQRAGELFADALDLPPDEIPEFLNRLVHEEPEMADEVRSLLAAHRNAGASYLATPAIVAWETGGAGPDGPAGTRDEAPRPDLVGPFRLLSELGRGGMGRVFLAERVDGAFEQQVAIKLLERGTFSAEAQRRFRMERQILARLDHPGIARLLDGGVMADGQTWFALEVVDGVAIDCYCHDHRLGIRARLELFLRVLDAVAYAHRRLVVHRDLKPPNVLVTPSGEVKLLDFGIAKVLEDEPDEAGAASTQMRALTPRYAAPEQLRGEPVTTATDVYSLGVLLFELLTGRSPYRRPDRILRSALDDEPLTPSTALSGASLESGGVPLPVRRWRGALLGDLDAILLKALRKEPAERYATVAAFAEDLRRHLQGRAVAARGDARAYRLARFISRHRTAAAAATLVLLALASGLLAALAQARRAEREQQKAEEVQTFLLRLLSASDPAQAKGASVTVREVLDAGAREIETSLADEPDVRDRALDVLASVYLQLGEYDAALPLAERRTALRRARFGAESSEAAEAELLRANILWDRGRLKDAEASYRSASAVLERHLPAESPVRREALGGVAACLRARGDLAGAEALQRRLLELARRVDGPESDAVLGIENSLAMTLGTGERYRESAALLEHIVAADASAGRSDLPDSLTHRYNLAVDRARGGEWRTAGHLFDELLPAMRHVLGAAHPRLARALRWQAWLLDERGEPAAAAAALAECERIQVAAFGENDAELGPTRALGARIGAHLGDPSAVARARAAAAALEASLGPADPGCAAGWEAVAEAQLAAGNPTEARRAAEYGVALRRIPGLRGRSLAAALDLEATAVRRQGDASAASALGEEALAIWNETPSPDNPEAARARLHLAQAYFDLGNLAGARALLAAARPVFSANYAPGARELAEADRLSERLDRGGGPPG